MKNTNLINKIMPKVLAISLLTLAPCFSNENAQADEMKTFITGCFKEVKESILEGDAEDKSQLVEFVQTIEDNGFTVRIAADSGGDAGVRPLFVTAQAEFERNLVHHLETGDIVELTGIIHTPTPATPLCTEGEISEGLVDLSLEKDSKRLYTVQKRPDIIRNYLKKGGGLAVVYPKSGREKRSAGQLEIFEKMKEAYPNSLFDAPIDSDSLRHDMIGALYMFKHRNGEYGTFSIKAYQANAPEDEKSWGIWFGSLRNRDIHARTKLVYEYFDESIRLAIANWNKKS